MIGTLFLAGAIPGLLLADLFPGLRRVPGDKKNPDGERASVANRGPVSARAGTISNFKTSIWRERLEVLPRLLPFALLIFTIMSGFIALLAVLPDIVMFLPDRLH